MTQHSELFIRTDSSAVAIEISTMLVAEGEDFTYVFNDTEFSLVEAEQFDVQLVCGYSTDFAKGMFNGVINYMSTMQKRANMTVHSEHGLLIEVWND